jgi:acyl carrier protein
VPWIDSMVAKTWTRAELVEYVVHAIRDLLRVGDDFTAETDLIASGLDSLTLTQLLLALEEETGVWVDERRLTPQNLASAERLATCVFEQMANGAGT